MPDSHFVPPPMVELNSSAGQRLFENGGVLPLRTPHPHEQIALDGNSMPAPVPAVATVPLPEVPALSVGEGRPFHRTESVVHSFYPTSELSKLLRDSDEPKRMLTSFLDEVLIGIAPFVQIDLKAPLDEALAKTRFWADIMASLDKARKQLQESTLS